ncbi:MAG: potassium channel family protein [Wenzhouxiangellaceae bacterium]
MDGLFTVFVLNLLLVAVAVVVHYEFLYRASQLADSLRMRHRSRVLLGVVSALTAHSVEIWVFGIGYWLAEHQLGLGALQGRHDGSLLDSVYFSFTTFSTLGYGDVEPVGPLRFTAGIEALAGLVLITWSASFLFIEMQRYWKKE